MEYPNEWLAYGKAPKDMRCMLEIKNGNRTQNKTQNSEILIW